MTGFLHWLKSLIVVFSVGASTLSCQVLFGDFNVGDRARAGAGGGSSGDGPGASGAEGGGLGSATTSGPIVVFPKSGLFTSDRGAQAKFYVSLAQKPSAAVTLPVASTNSAEGTVSPETLSFTTDDWNAPQPITVTGVHDPQLGNQNYTVVVGPATSDDPIFRGATAVVPLTNIDNDGAGFFVTPTAGLVTTEGGGQAFFTVVLNSPPSRDVTIALTSSDESAGKVSPSSLIFTADNWSALQAVTVTGQDDDSALGDRFYQITVGPLTSEDESFANLLSQTVSVLNRDNDRAGVIVALSPMGIDPSDPTRLRTSESGDSATFTVVLIKEPSKDVAIAMASNSSEGKLNLDSLTFTPANWSAPQTVTVIGQDNDSVADGNQPYQITLGPITSDDAAYSALTSAALPRVNVVNIDNDKADFSVTLLTGLDPNDPSSLLTSEQGTSATFSIALTSKPKASVQFELSSTVESEGKVSPTTLNFTDENWSTAQKVTVTGQGDDVKDGNVGYAVRIAAPMSEDDAYRKLLSRDVRVVNLDDDVASLTLKLLTSIEGGNKLFTTEAGGTATFSVALTSKPTEPVTLPVVSSTPLEGKVAPATLTFTAANYAIPQVVTVTGVDDSGADGNQPYTVTVGPSTSKDTNYVGLSQQVKVTNQDDDWPYLVVNPASASGTTTEKGGTATFTISLHSQPTVSVPVTITSQKPSEGTVSPGILTFTPANWSTPQTLTVTGVDDYIADGDQSYTVQVKGGGTDPNYMYSATSLSLVNRDDDQVGMKITAAANLQTTEIGGKATFTVALTSQPTGNVNITVSSSDITEGTALPASLTFTAGNWANPQTVTVTGVDDNVADGNQTYVVTLKTASSSADPKYVQLAASTVSLVNVNDDQVGITVTPTTCATTPTTSATFTVVLKSQPLGPVSIALSSDTPTVGTIAPLTMLSFTAANWNQAQTVTVTGLDDGTMGVMTPFKIVTAAAVSPMDSSYQGLNAADVSCVNTTPPPPDP